MAACVARTRPHSRSRKNLMPIDDREPPARRLFLRRLGGASGAALAAPMLLGGAGSPPAPARDAAARDAEKSRDSGYLSLGTREAACVEALVNMMCPADSLTPNGVDCGLHIYIDRQLAGAWGRGDRLYRQGPWRPGKPQHGTQSPLTPEEQFKAGVAALNREIRRRMGKAIEQLTPTELDGLLQDVAAGRRDDERFALGEWFDNCFYPLFVQACFADPLYGGNRDKVFWRAVGYPGLPALHARNVVEYRGRPYPGAAAPQSIEDFS